MFTDDCDYEEPTTYILALKQMFIGNIWRESDTHIYNVMNEDSGSRKVLKKDNAKSLKKWVDIKRFAKQGERMILHWEQASTVFSVPC